MFREELAFHDGFITIENRLAVYGGTGLDELPYSQIEEVADRAAAALAKDPTKTIPHRAEELLQVMNNGLAVVVFEQKGLNKDDIGRPLAFAKLKPYKKEGGEELYDLDEIPDLSIAWEAGSMLGMHALYPEADDLPSVKGLPGKVMTGLTSLAAWNNPGAPVIAVSREGNDNAHRVLSEVGVVFARKDTTRLQQTPAEQAAGIPVRTLIYRLDRPKR